MRSDEDMSEDRKPSSEVAPMRDRASSEVAPMRDRGAAETRSSAGMAIGIAIGVALLAGATVWFVLGRQRAPTGEGPTAGDVRGRPDPRTGAALPSVTQQTAARRLAAWVDFPGEPLAEPDGPVTIFEPILRLSPPFDAIDATVFDSLDTRIRLAQAWPVGREEVCLDEAGTRFACGLKARASLQNFMFGKAIVCTRLFLSREERRGVVDARCSVDGVDLTTHQIRAGYAFPTDLADASHHAAMAEARRQRAGVWAGPYSLPTIDRSEADIRDMPFGSLRHPMP
jgi:endonuclease YncB( thermonuclease family)